MKKLIAAGLTALALTGAVAAAPQPAEASSSSAASYTVVVRIDRSVPYSWRSAIAASVRVVDRHTATRMSIRSTCGGHYRCITFWGRTVRREWAAVTDSPRWPWFRIRINPQRNFYNWYVKRSIVTHELGHAFGIGYHSRYTGNVMYKDVFRHGGYYGDRSDLPRYHFNSYQRRILNRY